MKKNRVFTGDFIEILENSELRNVVGGYNDDGTMKTGDIVGCNWQPEQCTCNVDIRPHDGGEVMCAVSVDYSLCEYACGAESCYYGWYYF
jgi:hypothetical protein